MDKWATLITEGEANGCYPCDTCAGFRAENARLREERDKERRARIDAEADYTVCLAERDALRARVEALEEAGCAVLKSIDDLISDSRNGNEAPWNTLLEHGIRLWSMASLSAGSSRWSVCGASSWRNPMASREEHFLEEIETLRARVEALGEVGGRLHDAMRVFDTGCLHSHRVRDARAAWRILMEKPDGK